MNQEKGLRLQSQCPFFLFFENAWDCSPRPFLGHFHHKRKKRDGQICNISFSPFFTIKLGKNAKHGKICGGKRAHSQMGQICNISSSPFFTIELGKKKRQTWQNLRRQTSPQPDFCTVNIWGVFPFWSRPMRSQQKATSSGPLNVHLYPKNPAVRRAPDYSSNLCPPNIWSIWLFQGVFFGPFIQEKERKRAQTPPPPKKSYRSYFRWAQIRWVIRRSSSRTKNTPRSKFTTRSIFTIVILWFAIAAPLVRTPFSWELQTFPLSKKGPRRSKSGGRSKNTTAW